MEVASVASCVHGVVFFVFLHIEFVIHVSDIVLSLRVVDVARADELDASDN